MQNKTQQKLDKVRRWIIDPMTRFYGVKLDSFVIEAYVEDLGDYSDQLLEYAWKQVRQEVKSKPSLAHFVSAIKERNEKSPVGVSDPVHRSGEFYCKRDTRLADQVMRSPVGRLALQHNVGGSIWMLAWRDGTTPTEADVWKQKRAWQEATDKLVRMEEGFFKKSLLSMHQAFIDREEALSRRYAA